MVIKFPAALNVQQKNARSEPKISPAGLFVANPYQTPIAQQDKDAAPVSLTTGGEFLLAVFATSLLSLAGLVIHWSCQIALNDAVLANQIWVVFLASLFALASGSFASTRRICLPVANLVCSLSAIVFLLYLGYSSAIAWYSGVYYEHYAYLTRAFPQYQWIYKSIITVLTLASLLFLVNRIRRSAYISAFVQAFVLTSAVFLSTYQFHLEILGRVSDILASVFLANC